MPATATPPNSYMASLMSKAEIRNAWGRKRGPAPEVGDIVGWQLDPAHEVFYGFVRGWRKPTPFCLKVTVVGTEDRTFEIDPRDVVRLHRQIDIPGE